MTFVVLGVLAIVWVVVLGSYAKERMTDRRSDSVSAFHSQLSTLQRTQSGAQPFTRHGDLGRYQSRSASALACASARRRRKNVLLGLLSVSLVMVLFAVAVPGIISIGLGTISVAAFTGYVVLLVDRQRVAAEQRAKVRPISSARPRPVLRQTPVRQAAVGIRPR